ncbi:MAG: VanZ family protein [Candidatus Binatia bacterium]
MNDMKLSTQWRRVTDWLSVIVWAGLIFVFSTEILSDSNTAGVIGPLLREVFPSLSGDGLERIHLLVRKLGHFTEFFVLAVLIMRALRNQSKEDRIGVAIALSTLYAVSDELHQSAVPSRTAHAMDVLIDVCGGICGTLWFRLRNRGKKTP